MVWYSCLFTFYCIVRMREYCEENMLYYTFCVLHGKYSWVINSIMYGTLERECHRIWNEIFHNNYHFCCFMNNKRNTIFKKANKTFIYVFIEIQNNVPWYCIHTKWLPLAYIHKPFEYWSCFFYFWTIFVYLRNSCM